MLHQTTPKNFKPKFTAVGCFLEYNKEILLLLRQDTKPQGNTWGLPSGKVEEGENTLTAMIRELSQETGIQVQAANISHFSTAYVRYPDTDFIYDIFHIKLDDKPKVKINPEEHKEHKWTSPGNAKTLELIQDLDACIGLFYGV